MKRFGLVLAAAFLFGLPALAQSDTASGNPANSPGVDNYGEARRRLAQHQREEFQRLKEHQKLEREACRADASSQRCRNLKQHQKRERDRVKAHHKRERNRLRDRGDGRRDARRDAGRDGRRGRSSGLTRRSGSSRRGRGAGRF